MILDALPTGARGRAARPRCDGCGGALRAADAHAAFEGDREVEVVLWRCACGRVEETCMPVEATVEELAVSARRVA